MTTTATAGLRRPWSALPLFARVEAERESSVLLPFANGGVPFLDSPTTATAAMSPLRPLTATSATSLPSPPQNTCHTAPAEDDAYIPEPAAGEKRSTSDPLKAFGIPLYDASVAAPKAWRCGFPGCASQVLFTRGCDLHKHYRRHSQRFYCRVDGCPRSSAAAGSSAAALDRGGGGGDSRGPTRRRWWFASKKDRDRHEAKHSPRIRCSWQGAGGDRCERVFSRLDNMKDHVRRVHRQR